jgi:hypothetical protein
MLRLAIHQHLTNSQLVTSNMTLTSMHHTDDANRKDRSQGGGDIVATEVDRVARCADRSVEGGISAVM